MKRTLSASRNRFSEQAALRKRRRRNRGNAQDVRHPVHKGFTPSNKGLIAQLDGENLGDPEDYVHFNPATMSWNGANTPMIRTSLRGASGAQSLGQNRLASGFVKPQAQLSSNAPQVDLTRTLSNDESVGESEDIPIEISDDDTEEDVSDEEGGMMINVKGQSSEDEGLVSESQPPDPQDSQMSEDDTAHQQLQGDLDRSFVVDLKPTTTHTGQPKQRLAELNPEELDEQLTYTLFHLPRTQIDLNRFVICLGCQKEGHILKNCPERVCTHCGAEDEHPSRACPYYRRCLRCRERGHDSNECGEKLRNTTIPCDYCESLQHMEDACPLRFFPPPAPTQDVHHKLWISCCNCADKTHLVGDCPQFLRAGTASRWSLKSLDPEQVTNLSLESGTKSREKDAANRNMRPEGMKIKGRAGNHQSGIRPDSDPMDEDDEPFIRPRVDRLSEKQSANGFQFMPRPTQSYQQDTSPSRYDRFNPPQEARERDSYSRGLNNWYQTDSFGRRRSRSPVQSYNQNSYRPTSPTRRDYGGGDSYRPGDSPRYREPPRHPASPQYNNYRTPPQHPLPRRLVHSNTPSSDNWRPPLPAEPVPGRLPANGGQRMEVTMRPSSDQGRGQTQAAPGQSKRAKKRQKKTIANVNA